MAETCSKNGRRLVSHYRLSNIIQADAVTCGDENENGKAQEERALMDSKSMVHVGGGDDDNETGNNINWLQDKYMKISTLVQSQMTQRLGKNQEQGVRLV